MVSSFVVIIWDSYCITSPITLQPLHFLGQGDAVHRNLCKLQAVFLEALWLNSSWINYILSAKPTLPFQTNVLHFLAIGICPALLGRAWKFDRVQELDAIQWWIFLNFNYNSLSINSSFITVLHKRRKSSSLVMTLKEHTNDQRRKTQRGCSAAPYFGGGRQSMTRGEDVL